MRWKIGFSRNARAARSFSRCSISHSSSAAAESNSSSKSKTKKPKGIKPFDAAKYAGKTAAELTYMTMGTLNILSCLGSRMSDREAAAAARRGSKWIMEHFSEKPDSITINFKKGTAKKGRTPST